MKRRLIILLLPIMLMISTILPAADVPYLTGRITDNAQLLSQEVNRTLSDSRDSWWVFGRNVAVDGTLQNCPVRR